MMDRIYFPITQDQPTPITEASTRTSLSSPAIPGSSSTAKDEGLPERFARWVRDGQVERA